MFSISQPAPPTGDPPKFGHDMLKEFAFDPDYINLNNGSYGSLPNYVAKHYAAISAYIEGNPDLFMRLKLPAVMAETRSMISQLIGAQPDEVAFVPNATHGINTILRNIDWKPSDILIGCNTTYGAISRTIQYVSDFQPNPKTHTIPVQFPTTHSDIVTLFEKHFKSLERLPDQKVVAVIDGISSTPGCVFPWEALVELCKKYNIISLIDGAHCIGQIPLNLAKADPDFFVTVGLSDSSKRSSAVLYVPKRNQHIIKTSIPTSANYISPMDPVALGGPTAPNFIKQFEWNGTYDYANYFSLGAALAFRQWLGGEEAINNYRHSIAVEGGEALAKILGTKIMDERGELTANMTNVGLEFPDITGLSITSQYRIKVFLEKQLLEKYQISAMICLHNSKWWVRCSAEIWNEVSDFEKLGEALLVIGKDLAAFVDGLK